MYRVFPLTPLFTLACLGLMILVWRQSAYLDLLDDPRILVLGLCSIVLSGSIALFGRKSFALCYDLFACGVSCTWFVHWREAYRIDAPVFAWYPIFFVLLIVVLNGQVIHQSDRMDPLQQRMIRLLHSSRLLNPLLLTAAVLLSVYFSEHYIFYPIAMALFLIRCSFAIVLRESSAR